MVDIAALDGVNDLDGRYRGILQDPQCVGKEPGYSNK
jgi:hypothetical protein